MPQDRQRKKLRDYLQDDPLALLIATVLSTFLGLTGVKGTNELTEIRKTLAETNATVQLLLTQMQSHDRRISKLETLTHPDAK